MVSALKFGCRRPGRSNAESGFTLIELMIVMTIIGILSIIAIPSFVTYVKRAKEAALREDLYVMRTAIDSYTNDKQKAPQSLDDLVQGGYLKVLPKDPMTQRTDSWVAGQSDSFVSIDETEAGGINDVHSGSQEVGTDGTSYATW
jgi:general secretion pathway protein G